MNFDGQLEGEEVLVVFRRHPIVMRRGFIAVMLGLVLGALFGLWKSQDAATMGDLMSQFLLPILIGGLIGMVPFFYSWIGWYYSVCVVTNQRFVQIQQKGIFKSRSVNDINLHRILSVNYEIKGMVETLLGFGTIIIQTLVGDFVIRKVPKPASTQADIVSAINESGVELDKEEIEKDY